MSRSFRLVAIDLDGTLLSSSQQIPEKNREALAECSAAGIAVAIVTGRRFPGARPYLRQLDSDIFVVANSGAIIKRSVDGSIMRRRLLGTTIAERVIDIAESAEMEVVVHDGPNAEGRIFVRKRAQNRAHLARYLKGTDPPPEWIDDIQLRRDPVQLGFAASVAAIRDFTTRLTDDLGPLKDDVSLARTEYEANDLALLDVLGSGATKSSGLQFLGEQLGISMFETLAIGDNWNDLDMLEHAGQGIVMQNAPSELKEKGFEHTGSNDDAGVAAALRQYVLC